MKLCLTLVSALAFSSVQADEGMWLLQMMKEQHLTDQMKKQGLRLEAECNQSGLEGCRRYLWSWMYG